MGFCYVALSGHSASVMSFSPQSHRPARYRCIIPLGHSTVTRGPCRHPEVFLAFSLTRTLLLLHPFRPQRHSMRCSLPFPCVNFYVVCATLPPLAQELHNPCTVFITLLGTSSPSSSTAVALLLAIDVPPTGYLCFRQAHRRHMFAFVQHQLIAGMSFIFPDHFIYPFS